MEPQPQPKDKSAWRKSQLNVSNSEDTDNDGRKLRRVWSRGSVDASPPLEVKYEYSIFSIYDEVSFDNFFYP